MIQQAAQVRISTVEYTETIAACEALLRHTGRSRNVSIKKVDGLGPSTYAACTSWRVEWPLGRMEPKDNGCLSVRVAVGRYESVAAVRRRYSIYLENGVCSIGESPLQEHLIGPDEEYGIDKAS